MKTTLVIRGADLVTPSDVIGRGRLAIAGGRIREAGAGDGTGDEAARVVDAEGLTAFPGLINAHDHLVGTWSPKAGNGPYRNVYEWLADYDRHEVRLERMKLDDRLPIRLGAFKNLLGGAATVLDHFQRLDDGVYENLPLRVERGFAREWVWRSVLYPDRYPPWGRGVKEEMAASGGEAPFVIHLSEGRDEECAGELRALDGAGGLKENTVLVHGLGFTDRDMDRIAEAGAKVVWCPRSNHFLYGETTDVLGLRKRGVPVALGTDSSVTGSAHLLEELRYARKTHLEKYGLDLPPRDLVAMVTSAPASLLMAETRLGALKPLFEADVLLVEGGASDPYERLLQAEPGGVDLLLVGGVPAFGAPRHEALFQDAGRPWTRVSVGGRDKLLTGDLPGEIREIRKKLGYEKRFPFLPLDAW